MLASAFCRELDELIESPYENIYLTFTINSVINKLILKKFILALLVSFLKTEDFYLYK